jgi:hypothetical protein
MSSLWEKLKGLPGKGISQINKGISEIKKLVSGGADGRRRRKSPSPLLDGRRKRRKSRKSRSKRRKSRRSRNH